MSPKKKHIPKKEKKMSDKARKFCFEYLIDLNATQAAIRAGYSEKTAGSQGQRLLKNVAIAEFLDKVRKRHEKRTIMGFDEACEILTAASRGVVADYLNEDGTIDFEAIREKNPEAVLAIETAQTNGMPSATITKFKLKDSKGALELLGKWKDWNAPVKQEVTTVWREPDGIHEGL